MQYEIMLLKEENKAKDDEIRSVWYEAQKQSDSKKSLVIFKKKEIVYYLNQVVCNILYAHAHLVL